MFAVTVVFEIHDGQFETFMPLMVANAQASVKQEPGCSRFDVCTDPDRPGEVFLYELYDDEAAFKAHLETPHFAEFDRIGSPMIANKTLRTYAQVAS
ncbi:putative quinol monooxygenase [Labrenzia sp. 011]|uniref:putative quinol monooxygenase n=1 Tax=Labrenzia sp. 011 TaxID=2171494 RepID=UPI000D5078C4|nr:putative quinol monooxygenase [Labrenzia sp. 011]PVB60561.1 antibiotic biosynthesis monooxygenase [Labrenzia sp. 011]